MNFIPKVSQETSKVFQTFVHQRLKAFISTFVYKINKTFQFSKQTTVVWIYKSLSNLNQKRIQQNVLQTKSFIIAGVFHLISIFTSNKERKKQENYVYELLMWNGYLFDGTALK